MHKSRAATLDGSEGLINVVSGQDDTQATMARGRPNGRGFTRTAALALAAVMLAALVTLDGGASKPLATPGRLDLAAVIHHGPVNRAPHFVFGIYPGGAAGTVGPSGPVAPENPALRMAALERLRAPGKPLVLRLYASYTGANGSSAEQQVGQEIRAYGSAGFQTELVASYRPAGGGSTADVGGFVEFVRDAVRSLGHAHGFVSLQVTNEANQGGSPNTSDGYYAGAKDALIEGVIAAKGEIHADRVGHVKVGFNWAYATDGEERAFWHYLGHHGGRRFVGALDWVGLDVYPGTWGPVLGGSALAAETKGFIDKALHAVRAAYMPLAGIPHAVALRISETGYPTGPGRTDAMQVTIMKAAIDAVHHARGTYNITGLNWFDLRDADSSSPSFESQYGLMRDDYSPKPGFGAYRALVAKLTS